MENRYKIILSGNQIYKEAELPADMERVTVGTGIDCTVRLRRDLFFESIQIEFVKESGGWRATCSDNIYFTEGDIRKSTEILWKSGIRNQKDLYLELIFRSILTADRIAVSG